MDNRIVKSILFDHIEKASKIVNRINFGIENGLAQWTFTPKPTVELFTQLLFEHAKDICELSLCSFLREPTMPHFEYFITNAFPTMGEAEISDFKRVFMELGGVDLHNEIISHIGIQTFDVWEANQDDGCLNIYYVGDFRVLQWEREHLVDGVYYAKAINR